MMPLILFWTGLLFYADRADASPQPLRPVSQLEFDCAGIADGFYPNPFSCSAYYMCIKYHAYHSECVAGMLFHPATRYCQNATTVQCQTTRPASPTTALTSSTTSPTASSPTSKMSLTTLSGIQTTQRATMTTQSSVSGRPTSTVDCSIHHDGEYLVDPADCAGFYICDHGNPVHEQCAAGLYFSPTLHLCDFKDHVKNCP